MLIILMGAKSANVLSMAIYRNLYTFVARTMSNMTESVIPSYFFLNTRYTQFCCSSAFCQLSTECFRKFSFLNSKHGGNIDFLDAITMRFFGLLILDNTFINIVAIDGGITFVNLVIEESVRFVQQTDLIASCSLLQLSAAHHKLDDLHF